MNRQQPVSPEGRKDWAGITDLAAPYVALGHPHRFMIIFLLARAGGSMSVADLIASVGGKPSAISERLRFLESKRLISRERHGRSTMCRLNAVVLGDAAMKLVRFAAQSGYRPTA